MVRYALVGLKAVTAKQAVRYRAKVKHVPATLFCQK